MPRMKTGELTVLSVSTLRKLSRRPKYAKWKSLSFRLTYGGKDTSTSLTRKTCKLIEFMQMLKNEAAPFKDFL